MQLLNERIKQRTLPSTLLLIGASLPEAKEIAKQLLDHNEKVDSGNHPDLHVYSPEEKSELYSIAVVRSMIDEMALPPFEAARKVFILVDAEKMLPSQSNALLKTLEEPPGDAVIFLLSNHPEALLPTIRSRCTPFQFEKTKESGLEIGLLLDYAFQKDYAPLMQLLEEMAEELEKMKIEQLLEPLFAAAIVKRPFKKVSQLVEEASLAEQHNVKRKNLILNFLLSL